MRIFCWTKNIAGVPLQTVRDSARHPFANLMKTRPTTGFTLVEIMIVVVIIGMLAALAIPGFQKIRSSSQDKAVMSNARQLAAATDQYMMEYGKSTVSINRLVGLTNYVKSLDTVAQESYPLVYTAGVPITVTGVGGVRTITYGL